MNYYRRYPGDYARATGHLSLAEHGAYSLLMDHYYSLEQPLPAAIEALFRICRAMTKVEQDAVVAVANRFFPIVAEGERRNRRCDDEISQTANRRRIGSHYGKKGGRPPNETGELWVDEGNTKGLTEGSAQANGKGNDGGNDEQTSREKKALQTPDSRLQTPDPRGKGRDSEYRHPSKRSPLEFTVTADMRAWAVTHACRADVERETAKFRDHTFAQPKTDWLATWRNWMRKAHDDAPAKPKRHTTKFERAKEAIRNG